MEAKGHSSIVLILHPWKGQRQGRQFNSKPVVLYICQENLAHGRQYLGGQLQDSVQLSFYYQSHIVDLNFARNLISIHTTQQDWDQLKSSHKRLWLECFPVRINTWWWWFRALRTLICEVFTKTVQLRGKNYLINVQDGLKFSAVDPHQCSL